jgi:septum formation protein
MKIFPGFSKIILSSGSPRRKQLMEGLGLEFIVDPVSGDENFPQNLKAEDIPIFLSKKKSEAYKKNLYENEILITADTIVWIEDRVLNKPLNREEAIAMLQLLSGKTHEVYTGISLRINNTLTSFFDKTEVQFGKITNEEISYYVNNYKPYDKAGAYGAQEWLGYAFIENLNGSYFNVMGLPVHRLYQELKNIHTNLPKSEY